MDYIDNDDYPDDADIIDNARISHIEYMVECISDELDEIILHMQQAEAHFSEAFTSLDRFSKSIGNSNFDNSHKNKRCKAWRDSVNAISC